MTKRISVRIAADGSIIAEAGGRQGPKCLDDGPLIAELFDFASIVDSRLTSEYDQPALLETRRDLHHDDHDYR